MPHAIRARFTPEPADYVKAMLAFFLSQRSIVFLVVVSILFVGLAVPISLVYQAQGSGIAVFILAIALGYFLIAAATVTAPLLRLRRIAKQDERMRAETTWSIETQRIEVRNRFENTELLWGMFSRVIETRAFVLLVYAENRRQFTFLPKRAFSKPRDLEEFILLAREKLA